MAEGALCVWKHSQEEIQIERRKQKVRRPFAAYIKSGRLGGGWKQCCRDTGQNGAERRTSVQENPQIFMNRWDGTGVWRRAITMHKLCSFI